MISLGEPDCLAQTLAGLDVKSTEAPKMPGSMAWVAEALMAEREAIMQELMKRHNALLLELDIVASFGPQDSQKKMSVELSPEICPNLKIDGHAMNMEECLGGVSDTAEEGISNQESLVRQVTPTSTRESSRSPVRWECEGLDEATGVMRIFIRLRMLVFSNTCELGLAFLIVLNSLIMAVEAQYISFNTAHRLRLPGASPAEAEWPGAETVLLVLELGFGTIFALEVVVKFVIAPLRFVKSLWNWFDTVIVLFWVLSLFGMSSFVVNPMILRLLRLARLTRLLRLVKTVQLFDVLHLLIGSLKASTSVLLWSLFLLVAIMLVSALTFNFMLEPYILDESKPYDARKDVFERYGSFSRAFVTMFETTLGNWVIPLRLLHENVSEWYGPVFLIWLCVVNFAVVQVIRAVFMHETFKVASSDDDIMVMQKVRQMNKHSTAIQRFFEKADESGDGYLSLSEFKQITSDPTVRVWLGAMDLDVSDATTVFQLMGDKDGQLSAQELIQGVSRLKGAARSIDMIVVQTMCRRIEKHVMALNQTLADGDHSATAGAIPRF